MAKINCVITLLFLMCMLAVSSRPAPAQTLPAKVNTYLNKNYPGWKFEWERPGRRSVCPR